MLNKYFNEYGTTTLKVCNNKRPLSTSLFLGIISKILVQHVIAVYKIMTKSCPVISFWPQSCHVLYPDYIYRLYTVHTETVRSVVSSRAFFLHTVFPALFILLLGNPHLLEGSLCTKQKILCYLSNKQVAYCYHTTVTPSIIRVFLGHDEILMCRKSH